MPDTTSIGVLKMACGLSSKKHPVQAAADVAEQCIAGLRGQTPDLAMMYFTRHHADAARALGYAVRRRLQPRMLMAVSAESVVGGSTELEGSPGVSLLAASLPGVDLRPFRIADLLEHLDASAEGALAAAAGMTGTPLPYRGTLLMADPFSVPLNSLLPALSRARPALAAGARLQRVRPAPILGGLASAAAHPGENVFLLNDEIIREGGVGLSFSGSIRIDPLVSQGCRAFGSPLVITAGRGQIITSLGGRPALKALTDAIETLGEHDRKLCERGLLVGRVINEYKDRFGRDDFLIRNVLGVDKNSDALAVADLFRVGQTIQFHVRDASTATEDLQMLLDLQRLQEPPVGAMIFTCNGRGRRLFDVPNHDATLLATAFAGLTPGEQQAKAGEPVNHRGPVVPVAGFFAAGEIGPVGDGVFLHGQTASVALFRHGDN